MTYPLTVPPLRHRVRAALNQLRGVSPVADPVTGSTESTMVVAALHEARHNNLTVTVRTRGGHLHFRMTVDTVGARHANLTTDAGEQVIVPLRFIETVQYLAPSNGDQGLL